MYPLLGRIDSRSSDIKIRRRLKRRSTFDSVVTNLTNGIARDLDISKIRQQNYEFAFFVAVDYRKIGDGYFLLNMERQ